MSYIINPYRFAGNDTDSFIIEVKTDNTGTSNNDQFTIPTNNANYSYSYNVDWGDGNTDTGQTGDITHTYASSGTYEIKISGTFPQIYFNNGGDRQKILKVKQWGTIALSSLSGAFYGCSNLDITATDSPDMNSVTDMTSAFRQCSSLVWNSSVDNLDTSGVTTFFACFRGDTSFNQSINSWNMSSATNIAGMFFSCSSFNQNLNSWNLTSLTTLSGINNGIFQSCINFNGNISSWDVSGVSNFRNTFTGATAFNSDISGWDVSSGTNFRSMLQACSNFNQNIGLWNMGSATDISNMLFGASSFDQDLGSWNVANVTTANTFLNGTLSTSNYNSILALSDGWASLVLQSGVVVGFGSSTFTGSSVDSGTTDGTSANKLIDSSQNFLTTVSVGDAVKNTTDNTWTTVTAVDSDTQLSLNSDIMVSGEAYVIYSSDAAKGKASMIDTDNWTITDGGAV